MRNRDSLIRTALLVIVLTVAFFLRSVGRNWDNGWHLHPDERFLTMVGNAVTLPDSIGAYLNPSASPFNPANNGYPFFVYGTFPLLINKVISVIGGQDTYMGFTQMGRFLSALSDTAVVYVIFKITELLGIYTAKSVKKKEAHTYMIPFLAALTYAVMVLPIQLSHFFAVDTFANLFGVMAFYYALSIVVRGGSPLRYIGVGAAIGLAVGSKISMVFIVPLILVMLAVAFIYHRKKYHLTNVILCGGLLFLSLYLSLRLSSPYYFESGNPFDLRLSTLFQANLEQLKNLEKPESGFPPALQWINREPIVFSLYNMSRFGMGMPIFILGSIGACVILFIRKKEHTLLQIVTVWIVLFFIYQSTQISKAIRYFIILYPFVAIIVGYVVGHALLSVRLYRQRLLFLGVIVLSISFYAISYLSVYLHPSTRVAASDWMVRNIPKGASIVVEHWDDPLPLPVSGVAEKEYSMKSAPVFDPDTTAKWKTMDELTARPHFYVLSSNRAWGSIMRVPSRYPRMTEFYNDLFREQKGYRKVVEFHSYPSLRYLGIPLDFPDESAEETFTVYDHPTVKIYGR